MTISTNISFHGVSHITISEIINLVREDRIWQCVTLYLEDANGNRVQSLQVHAPTGQELKIHFEGAVVGDNVSLSDLDNALASFP